MSVAYCLPNITGCFRVLLCTRSISMHHWHHYSKDVSITANGPGEHCKSSHTGAVYLHQKHNACSGPLYSSQCPIRGYVRIIIQLLDLHYLNEALELSVINQSSMRTCQSVVMLVKSLLLVSFSLITKIPNLSSLVWRSKGEPFRLFQIVDSFFIVLINSAITLTLKIAFVWKGAFV